MPKIIEITSILEQFAPLEWQESWDNSGFQVGNPQDEALGALLTLDVTPETVDEATRQGCNLIISHHPLLMSPLKRITGQSSAERVVIEAIRRGITIYSCHTNIDSAPGGVNGRLADILGIKMLRPLERSANAPEGVGMGAFGEFGSPLNMVELLELLKSRLGLRAVRHSMPTAAERVIRTVALCGGSGASLIDAARASGADVYLSGDLKYHDFQRADNNLTIIDIGHRESEIQVLDIFSEQISKKFPNFAVRHSADSSSNPAQYYV